MASAHVIARRKAEASEKQEALMRALAERLGIEVPPSPAFIRQTDLAQVMQVERFNTFLEAWLGGKDASAGSEGLAALVLNGTVKEIEGHIERLEDASALDVLEGAENEREAPRKGVLLAIEKRKAALDDGEGGE